VAGNAGMASWFGLHARQQGKTTRRFLFDFRATFPGNIYVQISLGGLPKIGIVTE
jgi:hypothetical protein